MAPQLPGRREFLLDTSKFIGLFLLFTFGGCEALLKIIQNRPVRRRVDPSSAASMAQLDIYKHGITLMQALPAGDPRSWANQAAIHGSVCCGFNKCPHSSEFFFPWHRYYLANFESIIRTLTGEPNFGLPYWNWTIDNSIPAPFFDTGSPLFHPRDATATSVADTSVIGHGNLETILNEPDFFIFGSNSSFGAGTLESGPHNYIHGFVGGDMDSGGSAIDPIFWMHHCMVDYCWADWNINRGFDNPNAASWTQKTWNTDFVDQNGNPTNAESGLAVLFPLLSYQYECSQIGTRECVPLLRRSEKELEQIQRRLKKGADVQFNIKQRIPFSNGSVLAMGKTEDKALSINFDNVSRIFDEHGDKILLNVGLDRSPSVNGYFVRVFVNRPDATAQTSVEDPHFAGSFAFFGKNNSTMDHPMANMGHDHKPLFIVDLTATILRLKQQGLLKSDQPLTLRFVPVPIEPTRTFKEESITLTKFELLISTVTATKK